MSLLTALSAIKLVNDSFTLIKKVFGGAGSIARAKNQKEKDAEIDAQGDVDKKELKERLRGK